MLDAPAAPLEVIAEETNGAIVKKTVSLNYQLFVRPFFWIPENTMRQHEKEDGVPYRIWEEQGLVTATEGDIIDYTRIYQDITTKIVPRYPRLKAGTIGYDPAFATDIATKLRDLAGLQILEVLQNYKMISEPSQIIEALIKGKRVRHDGHRVLRWNWENAAVKTDDAGRIRPVKPKNPSKRIDGAMAMIMGEKVLSMQQPPPEPTFQMMSFWGGGASASHGSRRRPAHTMAGARVARSNAIGGGGRRTRVMRATTSRPNARLLSLRQAEAEYGIPYAQLLDLVKRGELAAVQPPNVRRDLPRARRPGTQARPVEGRVSGRTHRLMFA